MYIFFNFRTFFVINFINFKQYVYLFQVKIFTLKVILDMLVYKIIFCYISKCKHYKYYYSYMAHFDDYGYIFELEYPLFRCFNC